MTRAPSLAPADRSTLLRRIAVTLLALAVFRIGQWIPLPGLDLAALGGSRMTSIMALGITPLLTALILAESAMCASPRLRRWAATPAGNARLWRAAIVVALVLASLQSYGVASSLGAIPGLIVSPGWQFHAGAITSFLGATLIVVLLASWITARGIGYGLWVLFGAIQAEAFLQPLLAQLPLLATGALSPENYLGNVALRFGVLAAAIAALATLVNARPPLSNAPELIWSPLVAGAIVSLLLTAFLLPIVLSAPDRADFVSTAAFNLNLPLTALATAAIVLARRRSFQPPGERVNVAAAAPAILLLVLFTSAATLFPYAQTAVLLAAVGLMILDNLRAAPRDTEAAPLARRRFAAT
ncbi:hypothetical protein W911_11635 [Hyphomicrobium nitrativorans NL23]|uniref:Preprotein translocase subunit SecY n=1 Tax=Hyphomicrobium nitrativorans NL23 TaxID=1029756 RepID=V5SJF6_9HYPH|nr:preprotein translocase subunit SecY [Hyphomicrobium nitrativorans]AHB50225.1 hypothetical protein W911_11635 [Hyphomicrobium nitrativorans NL23]